jgi:type III secretion system low calcium response chaperone LcrH/SycD
MTALSEKEIGEFMETVLEFIGKGGTFQDMKGIDDQVMDTTYSVAYNLYNNKKFEDAEKVFMFLSLMNHYEKKYFMGMGACRQVLKKHREAIESYVFASLLDLEDPRPPFYAAACHIAMGDKEAAMQAYDAAADLAAKDTSLGDIESHARNMLELMKKHQDQPGIDAGGGV